MDFESQKKNFHADPLMSVMDRLANTSHFKLVVIPDQVELEQKKR